MPKAETKKAKTAKKAKPRLTKDGWVMDGLKGIFKTEARVYKVLRRAAWIKSRV